MDIDVQKLLRLAGAIEKSEKEVTTGGSCAYAKTINTENRTIRFLASTGDLDRDQERIPPSAFKKHIDKFMSNGVVLAGHAHALGDGHSPVIGKAVKASIDNKGLWITVQFAETDLAEEYWQLYSQGFMKAVSVGFIPHKFHEEVEGKGTERRRVRVHDEVELIELSLVSIPSNPNALAKHKDRRRRFVQDKRQQRQEDKRSMEFARMLLGVDENGNYKNYNTCGDGTVDNFINDEPEIPEHIRQATRGMSDRDAAETILPYVPEADAAVLRRGFNLPKKKPGRASLRTLVAKDKRSPGAKHLMDLAGVNK